MNPIFTEILKQHGLIKEPQPVVKVEVPWIDYDPIMREEKRRSEESRKQNKLHWTGD